MILFGWRPSNGELKGKGSAVHIQKHIATNWVFLSLGLHFSRVGLVPYKTCAGLVHIPSSGFEVKYLSFFVWALGRVAWRCLDRDENRPPILHLPRGSSPLKPRLGPYLGSDK